MPRTPLLSEAQRRAILIMPTDGRFIDYKRVMQKRNTRAYLANIGLIEPERSLGGVITLWYNIRLTAFGLEVRRRLESSELAVR